MQSHTRNIKNAPPAVNKRGRFAPEIPRSVSAEKDAAPFAWPWNHPRPAIDPATFGRETPRQSKLAQWIACYARDNGIAQERPDMAAGRVEDDGEELSPLLLMIEKAINRDEIRDDHLARTKEQRRNAALDKDRPSRDELAEQPTYIREPLTRRLRFLEGKQREAESAGKRERPSSGYLQKTLPSTLERLNRTDARFLTHQFGSVAANKGFIKLVRLPHLTKREVRTEATIAAGAFDKMFCTLCDADRREYSPEVDLKAYQVLGLTALKLHITPPAWAALRTDGNRRTAPDMERLPGALSRIMCANWWYRKFWQLRRIWREERLRAAGQVSRKTSPYLSKDALIEHREQRRRLHDFLKSHELVNDEGFTLDLEDAYYAGNSNPVHRRCEMMTAIKGMELVAEDRGDKAVFMTVTCPSRFHATLQNGKPNPKWDGSTVRDSSDYLVNVFFSGVRKKLDRKKLRWYGVRVAEPHHDGTVHWHMLVFTHPDSLDAVTAIVREFAIREDRAELGSNITPRFESELITREKGSPTAYIATYIGKGIDGSAVGGTDPKTGKPRVDDESGKPMAETVEHVIGWAGLHRVQQFRFFGIPSRQTYRELRRLAVQMARAGNTSRLDDPGMDAVLIAADAGCFASYITKQGGVLIPRKDHVIRTAYDLAEKPNDYGENGIQIYGIWSPALGDASRVCTHPDNWTLSRKKVVEAENTAPVCSDFDRQGGPAAPWTRGNNCPPEQNTHKPSTGSATPPISFDAMTPHERKLLRQRLLRMPPPDFNRPKDRPGNRADMPPVLPGTDEQQGSFRLAVMHMCNCGGLIYSDRLAALLVEGKGIRSGNSEMVLRGGNELMFTTTTQRCTRCGSVTDTANPVIGEACCRCATDEELDNWL